MALNYSGPLWEIIYDLVDEDWDAAQAVFETAMLWDLWYTGPVDGEVDNDYLYGLIEKMVKKDADSEEIEDISSAIYSQITGWRNWYPAAKQSADAEAAGEFNDAWIEMVSTGYADDE